MLSRLTNLGGSPLYPICGSHSNLLLDQMQSLTSVRWQNRHQWFEVIKTGARDDAITLPSTFYLLGQCWDIFPPVIWCATKDSGDPRSHIDSHCATDDQFDEPNFSEDSHWLIFCTWLSTSQNCACVTFVVCVQLAPNSDVSTAF